MGSKRVFGIGKEDHILLFCPSDASGPHVTDFLRHDLAKPTKAEWTAGSIPLHRCSRGNSRMTSASVRTVSHGKVGSVGWAKDKFLHEDPPERDTASIGTP